ncbi:MAG TPA: enediyne biosynthesis protein [Mycobacteriales bacterium]|jgi:hypothetical protein|nr:enediyne biosynthesis protein [Mycobacteriales bacterium]
MTDVRHDTDASEGLGAGKPASTPATEGSGAEPRPVGGPAVPRDPRYLALRNFAIALTVFNILGYTVLGFEQPWTWPLFALAVGYSTEITIELISAWAARRPVAWRGKGFRAFYIFLLPAHITSLATSLLLYTNDRFAPVAFGVVVALGAKTVLRAPIAGRMRHFMNPSNFGISVTLLVFPAWVGLAPPYHFTEEIPDVFRLMIPMVILTAGTVLNAKLTGKTPLIVGWAGSFAIQAIVRHVVWDVALWSALSVMTGVAFVLFTNYMITDPATTPRSGWAQFLFGSAVGTVYGVLLLFNVVFTLFFALSIVCAGRGLYWWGRWCVDRLRRDRSVAPLVEPVTT